MISFGYCSVCGEGLLTKDLEPHATERHADTKIVYLALYRPTAEDLERMAAAVAELSPPR